MKKLIALALVLAAGSAGATITTIGDVTPVGTGYTLSTDDGVSDGAIEAFLGLGAGTLDAISSGNAVEGSALSISTNVGSGDTLSFDWFWTSNEFSGAFFNDFAFVSVSLDGIEILADTFSLDGTIDSFSFTTGVSGALTVGIGVMDVNDGAVASFLDVDNIAVVPAPASLLLLGLGLAGLGVARRRA
ncbi:MAG: PEP-CTERM sorting domain-containing protein [Pseudomonadota bacterium]